LAQRLFGDARRKRGIREATTLETSSLSRGGRYEYRATSSVGDVRADGVRLRSTVAADAQRLYVQEAEIEIDRAQLDAYKSALTEHIETAARVEPGVRGLYAVFEKIPPCQGVRDSRDLDAYRSRLETAQFENTRRRWSKWYGGANGPVAQADPNHAYRIRLASPGIAGSRQAAQRPQRVGAGLGNRGGNPDTGDTSPQALA
jgi:hypothetical protein